jgi:iron complex outermembrane recepter protein
MRPRLLNRPLLATAFLLVPSGGVAAGPAAAAAPAPAPAPAQAQAQQPQPEPRVPAPPAHAQSDAGIMAADTLRPLLLEGVSVQILRSPVQLNRAPFAVSVIGQELGERGRGGFSIEEALHGLPGVQVQNRYNDAVGELISIRGFGARSQFGVRGIQIVVDGIPATLPDGQASLDHLDLASLGRVEALRGPGAALYGNAAGGVLTFQSLRPTASPLRQEFRYVQGDHGMRRMQATTSGVAGGLQYRVSLGRNDWDGFRTRIGGESGAVYGASRKDQANAMLALPIFGGTLHWVLNHLDMDAENPGSLNRADFDLGDRRAFPGNVNQRTGKTVDQTQMGLSWSGLWQGRTVEFSGYGIRRDLTNPIPSAIVQVDRVAGGLRSMVQAQRPVSFGAGPLAWTLGAELSRMQDDRFNWTNAQGSRGNLTVDQEEIVTSGAVFMQGALPLSDRWDLMTGARYDRIEFRAEDRMFRAPPTPLATGSRSMDAISPSVGLHGAFSRALGTYIQLSSSFETPTTTELANRPEAEGGFNPELNPQRGITAEVGGRGLLGRGVAWELAYFHTSLVDELVSFEVENAPGRRYFRNSGRSKRTGVEATVQMMPIETIELRLVGSTNRARFRNYTLDGNDFRGNRVPGVTPWQAEALLRMRRSGLFGEVRYEIAGGMATNDANVPGSDTPIRRLLDLRASAEPVEILGFQLQPFAGITNVLDVAHVSSVAVNAFGARYFEPGPPRSLYLGINTALQR